MATNRDGTLAEFHDLVNIRRQALQKWLDTDESKNAGQHKNGKESTGHASGRRIVTLLRTKNADLSDDDLAHMRKVNGYIQRHLALRRPARQTWRRSLMNWGHDPLQDE